MSRNHRPILLKQLTADHLTDAWESKVLQNVKHVMRHHPTDNVHIFTEDRAQSFRFMKRLKNKFPHCEVRREVDFFGVYHILMDPPCYN